MIEAEVSEMDHTPEILEDVPPAVAIVDTGSQYVKVYDRRIRDLGVRSEMVPASISADELKAMGVQALVVPGGPDSVYAEGSVELDQDIYDMGLPTLFTCYGMQRMSHDLGGTVTRLSDAGLGDDREDGISLINIVGKSPLFEGLEKRQEVVQSHGDLVTKPPEGFTVTARSTNEGIAAIEDPVRGFYATQFHPEVDNTANGNDMISHFLFDIAGLEKNFTAADRHQEAIEYIQETVGDKELIAFLSGGVDSSVLGALLHEALPDRDIPMLFVDHGFMREGEAADVKAMLAKAGLSVEIIDAKEEFLNATTEIDGVETPPLREVYDPEVKRKIFGDTFMRLQRRLAIERGFDPDSYMLAQGTLRPDLIESASKLASSSADVIKTHHNDTQLAREMREQGRLVEPLVEFHKDEVRKLGSKLGLPDAIVKRHPFPGPGGGIEIISEPRPYITEMSEIIDKDLESLTSTGIRGHTIPVRTVGIQGDNRTYGHLVGLSGDRDWGDLQTLARAIPKKYQDVNRVVYVFGDPIEESLTTITDKHLLGSNLVVNQWRRATKAASDTLKRSGYYDAIAQMPIVSTPADFGVKGSTSIGIRTFLTNDFMTGDFALPGRDIPEEVVLEMVANIMKIPGVSRVMYDLTSKPPGTTEWL